MLVVMGRVKTDDAKREELLRVAHANTAPSRAEKRCVGYRFYEDTEERNSFVFVEEWESLDALKEHFGTPHIATFMRAIASVITAPPDVQVYEVATTMTLAEAAS